MLKYALAILALATCIALGQVPSLPLAPPKTSAEAESRANDAHLKAMEAYQRLQSNPDYMEWMRQQNEETSYNLTARALRNQENEARRKAEAAKSAAPVK